MKIRSCLHGASIIGAIAGLLRLAQYIFTVDQQGFYKEGLLSLILNIALITLLGIGAIWILICGFAGKKKETPFAALYEKSGGARLCFLLLGILTLAEGILQLMAFFKAPERLVLLLFILCIGGGIGWIILAMLSARGKGSFLAAVLPILQLGAFILNYFWQTYKYIHISEYILVTLGLCAFLLFAIALLKPAGGGSSTRQRLCATAGLSIIFGIGVFLPLLPARMMHGFATLSLQDVYLFIAAILWIVLSVITLKRLSALPKEQPIEEPAAPDLSALNEYLSDLPEIEDEEEESEE